MMDWALLMTFHSGGISRVNMWGRGDRAWVGLPLVQAWRADGPVPVLYCSLFFEAARSVDRVNGWEAGLSDGLGYIHEEIKRSNITN